MEAHWQNNRRGPVDCQPLNLPCTTCTIPGRTVRQFPENPVLSEHGERFAIREKIAVFAVRNAFCAPAWGARGRGFKSRRPD